MMGLVRKIVYQVLIQPSNQNITHDILCILVPEIITSQLPTVDTNAFDLFCAHTQCTVDMKTFFLLISTVQSLVASVLRYAKILLKTFARSEDVEI